MKFEAEMGVKSPIAKMQLLWLCSGSQTAGQWLLGLGGRKEKESVHGCGILALQGKNILSTGSK